MKITSAQEALKSSGCLLTADEQDELDAMIATVEQKIAAGPEGNGFTGGAVKTLFSMPTPDEAARASKLINRLQACYVAKGWSVALGVEQVEGQFSTTQMRVIAIVPKPELLAALVGE